MEKFKRNLFIGLIVAVLISPLGILLPKWFNAGDAWGEWSTETVNEELGYVPDGMQKDADIWKAPLPDYSLGNENAPFAKKSVVYILSAIVGIVIISFFSFGLSKMIRKE